MLKVSIAEVNRSLLKKIGVNLLTQDPTGGFKFGIGQGKPGIYPAASWPDQRRDRGQIIRSAIGSTIAGHATQAVRPRPLLGRSTSLRPTASSPRSPSRT